MEFYSRYETHRYMKICFDPWYLRLGTEAKIDELQVRIFIDEDIFRLEVPMCITCEITQFIKSQNRPLCPCYGSESGIRCLFDPWILDPESGMGKKIFGLKYSNSIRTRDSESF
jgi:hypothetical protein